MYNDKNIQEIEQVLIDKGKLLNRCCRYKESLLLKLKKNQISYFFNRRKIGELLKKYGWDSQEKIQETFHTWNECLLDLENKIPDHYYPIVELPGKEDFVETFRQTRQKTREESGENTLIKIVYLLILQYLSNEPKQELDLNILPHSNLEYSREKVLAANKYSCLGFVDKHDDISLDYCRVFAKKETVYQ